MSSIPAGGAATPVTMAGLRRGMAAGWPFLLSSFVTGIVMGVTYRQIGLDGLHSVALSATIFSGTAQAATAAMWLLSPLPLGAMALAIVSMNARYIVMGAHLRQIFPLARKRVMLPVLFLLVDGAWLITVAEAQRGRRDIGVLIGASLPMYVGWVAGTAVGYALGLAPHGPLKAAAAFLPLAFIVALIPGQWRGRSTAVPWLLAAASTLAALALLPVAWAGLAGGAVGAVAAASRRPA